MCAPLNVLVSLVLLTEQKSSLVTGGGTPISYGRQGLTGSRPGASRPDLLAKLRVRFNAPILLMYQLGPVATHTSLFYLVLLLISRAENGVTCFESQHLEAEVE